MAGHRKIYKIGEHLKTAIALAIQRCSDPRLSLVTITRVTCSPDLSYANVYWTFPKISDKKKEDIASAFESAEGFIKKTISKNIRLRRMPKLRFFHDDSMEQFERTKELIHKVRLLQQSEDIEKEHD